MVQRIKGKAWLRDVIAISVIMLLIHGFLLLLTGTFHDDWLSLFKDATTKDMEGMESGRPYYSAVIKLVWNLPGYSYRILIYVTYWLSYLFIYGMLSNVDGLNRQDALLMTIITIAVPINDARALLANYPYALGMLLFFSASYLLAKYIDRLGEIRIRIGILCLFFLSYTLNSNLVLYGIVLLYMVFKKRWRIYRYVDFFLIPFVFYFLNNKLFPTYGSYEKYNEVNWDRMNWAFSDMPEILSSTIISIIRLVCAKSDMAWKSVKAAIAVFLAVCFYRRLNKTKIKNATESGTAGRDRPDDTPSAARNDRDGLIALFGLAALVAGLFPYVVIRQYPDIYLVGIKGRDSINIGLGIALMLYGGLNRRVRAGVIAFIVAAGFFHFGNMYLQYQTEWYRQLSFRRKIVDITDMKNGGNYVVKCSQDSGLSDRRFYTWSGNAAVAFGKRNLFMMNGEKDIPVLQDEKSMEEILTHYPMFRDYQYDHKEVDGTIDYSVDLTQKETIVLKIYELFDPEQFDASIDSIGSIVYTAS